MAILSKGATIVADTQVSATNLNNLVDAATFVSGAVDGTTTQLSGGAIIVKDAGITPAKLSTGGPSWTSGGNLAVTGSTSVGTTSSSGQLTIGQVTNAVVDNAIILRTGSTKTAWLIGAQYLSDNSFEVIPSTAVGGTTFTNPVFRVNTSGVTVTGTITGTLTGNASTATAFATARTISITGDLAYTSPSFDGTGNVTAAGTLATVATAGTTGSSTAIPVVTINAKGLTTSITTAAVVAPAGTLSGSTLASGVTASSLTSVGTLSGLTVSAPISGSVTGNAATTTALQTARTINGVSFNGTADITVTAAAGTLSGATLASGVTASSLTSVGTLGSLTVTNPIVGSVTGSSGSTTGNAATATKIASITNSDIVQLTASQTLTNKTLTSPTITGTGAIAGNFTGPITGNVIASIANITLLDLVPEFGYATSGTITLNLAAASNAKIELAGNSTFALSGIDSGQINIIALKNNTGGSINTTWPAWTSAGGSFPASLTSGQAMVVSLYSYGSTTGSVYAVSSL